MNKTKTAKTAIKAKKAVKKAVKEATKNRHKLATITRRKLGFKDSEKLKAGDMVAKMNAKKKLSLKAGV